MAHVCAMEPPKRGAVLAKTRKRDLHRAGIVREISAQIMNSKLREALDAKAAGSAALNARAIAIDDQEIERTARELVDAYGRRAVDLMRQRTRAVRRRGDAESAMLWSAVAQAVEAQLALGASLRGAAEGD